MAKHVLGLGSTASLIRELVNNPFVAQACGVAVVPHEATFSRFFKRLAHRDVLPLVKDVSRALLRRHQVTLPAFGERVALDATVMKGWANGGKHPYSDTAAGWAVKSNTHGKKEYTYGWKLHLLVDAESELPISVSVSAGNVHDSQRASNVLREARNAYQAFKPAFVMADSGYSSKGLSDLIRRQYRAKPIIMPNKQHKRNVERTDITPEWKALYSQRQSVERAFSRLKGQRSLNRITTRGRMKVTLHCYLALIAMQATART